MNLIKSPTSIVSIFIIISISIINCENVKSRPALDKNYLLRLMNKHSAENECFENFENLVASKWDEELKKIPVNDIGEITREYSLIETSKPIYPTPLVQWLMENGSPSKMIDECFENLIEQPIPMLKESDKKCLTDLLRSHIKLENKLADDYANLINESSIVSQLPFRRFINFNELRAMMFQNRDTDSMTDKEREVYQHAESQLSDEGDKERKMFVLLKECEFKNEKRLRETSNSEELFEEFESQVRDLYDRLTGFELLTPYPMVNLTRLYNEHDDWLKKRDTMENKLREEISRLKNSNVTDQNLLCVRASKLARDFSAEQSSVIMERPPYKYSYPKVSSIADDARAVEIVLRKLKDEREEPVSSVANKIEKDARCIGGFSKLFRQHQLYEISSAFVGNAYTYPEIHCNSRDDHSRRISPIICNCIGSFCVKYGLDSFIEDEYEIKRDDNDVYKVSRVVDFN